MTEASAAPAEPREPIWSLGVALILVFLWGVLNNIVLVALLMLGFGVAVLIKGRGVQLQDVIHDVGNSPWAPFGTAACALLAWLLTFGLIEALFRTFPRILLGRALGLRAPTPRWALTAAIPTGIVICLAATALGSWLQSDDAINPFEQMLHTLPGFAGTAVMALLIAPPAEEIFFRGFLLPPMLRKFSPWVAVLLNGMVFSLAHIMSYQSADAGFLFPILLLGLVLAFLRVWSGSVIPGILAHFFFNGTSLVLFWLTNPQHP